MDFILTQSPLHIRNFSSSVAQLCGRLKYVGLFLSQIVVFLILFAFCSLPPWSPRPSPKFDGFLYLIDSPRKIQIQTSKLTHPCVLGRNPSWIQLSWETISLYKPSVSANKAEQRQMIFHPDIFVYLAVRQNNNKQMLFTLRNCCLAQQSNLDFPVLLKAVIVSGNCRCTIMKLCAS